MENDDIFETTNKAYRYIIELLTKMGGDEKMKQELSEVVFKTLLTLSNEAAKYKSIVENAQKNGLLSFEVNQEQNPNALPSNAIK